jgi:hypothetical protein
MLLVLAAAVVALLVLLHVVRFLALLRATRAENPDKAIMWSLFGAGTMVPMLCEVVLPSFLHFISSRQLHENMERQWREDGCKDVICYLSMFPLRNAFLVADAQLLRRLNDGQIIEKNIAQYGVLDAFGTNIVTTNGEEWKVRVCELGRVFCLF